MWVRIIVFKEEIVVLEVEYILFVGIDNHFGQGPGLTCKLYMCLLEVVEIEMCVSEGVD